ncbi:hypothetical protein [Novosphingopyxis sp.]|uniref:hypothetical protein n=1 Tax=Novosphingopyxis sp. TaxID=2709690 RepID=UPI003B5B1D91
MNWLFLIPGLLMLVAAMLIGAGDYSQRKAGEIPPRAVRTAAIGVAIVGLVLTVISFII